MKVFRIEGCKNGQPSAIIIGSEAYAQNEIHVECLLRRRSWRFMTIILRRLPEKMDDGLPEGRAEDCVEGVME